EDQVNKRKIAQDNIKNLDKYDELTQQIEEAVKKKTTAQSAVETKQKELEDLKRTQIIEWAAPAEIVHGTPLDGTQLNARVVVGDGELEYLSPVWKSLTGRILDAGDGQVLQAVAKGTETFKRSDPKEVTINVRKAELEITWPTPGDI